MKADLGMLQPLMDDPTVSEIMVNGPGPVFVERHGHKQSEPGIVFATDQDVRALAESIFSAHGKRLDDECPYADTCLDDGTRVNAILAPVSRFGTALTLRKFSTSIRTLDDLIARKALSDHAAQFLVACVKGKINMLFSGGTSTGKTTLLQMLAAHFDPRERVITIEDAAELRLPQPNVISLETRSGTRDGRGEVTLRDLMRNALRMAPDRLVIGEVRGGEAIDMIQAMETGHAGTIGVIHGSSPREVIQRLETMILMSGLNLDLAAVRRLIASTIALIVHMDRMLDGSRRVTAITEVRGIERDDVLLNNLFVFEREKTDSPEAVVGELKMAMRYFPQFFNKLHEQKLLDADVFTTAQAGADALTPPVAARRRR